MECVVTLHCPECQQESLQCHVAGIQRCLTVHLLSQACDCDPYHAWEDVWEEARELVFEQQLFD